MSDVKLKGLGVAIRDGQVRNIAWGNTPRGKTLGPVRGAHAHLGSVTSKHPLGYALAMAPLTAGLSLLVAAKKETAAQALIVFADGAVHQVAIGSKTTRTIAAAEADVARFNALAASTT